MGCHVRCFLGFELRLRFEMPINVLLFACFSFLFASFSGGTSLFSKVTVADEHSSLSVSCIDWHRRVSHFKAGSPSCHQPYPFTQVWDRPWEFTSTTPPVAELKFHQKCNIKITRCYHNKIWFCLINPFSVTP